MNTNYSHIITMQDYDNAKTPEEKRKIAAGFEECRNKTMELNRKYVCEKETASKADISRNRLESKYDERREAGMDLVRERCTKVFLILQRHL